MDLNKADRTLRNLKGQSVPYSVALGDGISCNVSTNGVRTLYLRSRLHGRVQRLKLGVYPDTSIRAAADKASTYRASLKSGLDPRVDAMRAENGEDVPKTVNEAVARFIDGHVKAKTRERWAIEAVRLLNAEVVPQVGSFPLVQLRRTDLTGLVERKAAASRKAGGKGVIANRLAAVISRWCSYCAGQGWISYELGRNMPKPATETARDRTLNSLEMGQLWNTLDDARQGRGIVLPVYASVLAMLALTGCRCSEVTGLKVSDVDLRNGLMSIKGGKTTASNRTLPLPPLARSILESQVAAAPEGEPTALLFPSPRAGTVLPSNEISRAARDLVKALAQQPWTLTTCAAHWQPCWPIAVYRAT